MDIKNKIQDIIDYIRENAHSYSYDLSGDHTEVVEKLLLDLYENIKEIDFNI